MSAPFYSARRSAVCCPAKLRAGFQKFKAQLPNVAKDIHYQPDEISGFGNYRTFVWCVTEILKKANRVA